MTLTLFVPAVIGRGLIFECFDFSFLRAVGGPGAAVHFVFLLLVVMNLIAGFHALGTLMAVGLMMLPASAARFWAGENTTLATATSAIASAHAGLPLTYRVSLLSGPAIIPVAGVYGVSAAAGPCGSPWARFLPRRHLEA